MGCSFWDWAGVGEGTGEEDAGEAGAAGSFSLLALFLLWFLFSDPAALGLSFASSFLRTRPLGDAVVPRGDGGLGGRVWLGPGLGEAGLCQDVEGEDGRALDLGLREKGRVRPGGHSMSTHTHAILAASLPQGTIPPRLGQHPHFICFHRTIVHFRAYISVCDP